MLTEYPVNAKHRFTIPLGFADLPVLLLRGANPGKTLVVSGAVHGDEYEGVRAILETFDELSPADMSGNLLAVPVANPPAFWAGTRTSPLDGGNLARVFPGDPQGTPTQVIAHHLGTRIIALADLYADFHSAGVGWAMPSMVGYDESDPRSKAAADAFGAEYVWGHPDVPPGRTVSFAKSRGIPFVYTEAWGAGRVAPEDLAMMKRGIRNLLRHLAILPGELERVPVKMHLTGEGNIHAGINAPARGFFISSVSLLDEVKEGQFLGRLTDTLGQTTHEFRAGSSGVIGLVRQFPTVHEGDPLFLIAQATSREDVSRRRVE